MNTQCYEENCNLHTVRAEMASRLAVMEEFYLVEAELSAQLRLALCKAVRLYPNLKDNEYIQRALAAAERIQGGDLAELFDLLTREDSDE